ncbi:MAG: Hsp70 family protein [Hamadaea sp.]|nr:Hsp70 family protein [Hamadaea sp.]
MTLAIDVGAHSVVAVAASGGRRIPVTVNGTAELPATVEGQNPKALLVDPAADPDEQLRAMTALLRQVARQVQADGGEIARLVVTVPAAWGPRRHNLLGRAAELAGHPAPEIVAEPVAAAAYAATQTPIAPGSCVLVCDVGARVTEVSLVELADGGWRLLATQPVPDTAAHRLQESMIDAVLGDAVPDPAAREAARESVQAAMAVLGAGRPAAIVRADGRPVVLEPGELVRLTEGARRELGSAITTAIDAADVDTVAAAVVLGRVAQLYGVDELITQRLGVVPVALAQPLLALPLGALDLVEPTTGPGAGASSAAGESKITWRSLRLGHTIIATLACLAGPAILSLELAYLEDLSRGYRDIDFGRLQHYFTPSVFALSGLLAAIGMINGGVGMAAIYQADDHDGGAPGRSASKAGRSLAFCAGVGLVLAGLLGLVAESEFGGYAGLSPNFLGTAVSAAVVPAALCIALGLLGPVIPTVRRLRWADRLRHPALAPLAAAAGIVALRQNDNRLWLVPEFLQYSFVLWAVAFAGATLLAVATAWTLVTALAARLVLAAVLAIGYNLANGANAASLLALIYVLAVIAWYLRQFVLIGYDALPAGLMRRITAGLTPSPQPDATRPGDASN